MEVVRKRVRLAAVAALAALTISLGGVFGAPAQASNTALSFNAGNIIDDALFYDGNAMTAAQVQTFLNEQVPNCWLGRPGYEIGKPVTWGGTKTKLASKCTRDYVATTETRAANVHCATYTGGKNETAAQIIAKVGKACGISQRVLLITLQKEQSLITDPWPNNEQYARAMGYACPDSGPGGTANCDVKEGGFFQQVYRAAWQLKVYKAFPNDYNYKPFQNNRVQWHPNTSCGASTVNIQNWATAALYIYTPYRPNQAALNAGWGTGDNCSSYGNRNFHNYYTSWFGDTRGTAVDSRLKAFYENSGGQQGPYGQVLNSAVPVGQNGIEQRFANGNLYWSQRTGAAAVVQGFLTGYKTAGGAGSYLGFPRGNEVLIAGGSRQEFEYGTGYWNARTGTAFINGAIRSLYLTQGGPSGYLGFPSKDELRSGGVSRQEFERGTAFWSASTGASVINGAIRSLYFAEGGPSGYLGLPVGPELRSGGVSRQEFERGTAFWSASTGASVINGAIRSAYFSVGGPGGQLGLPVGPERRSAGVSTQQFERGKMTWTAAHGVKIVPRSATLSRVETETEATPRDLNGPGEELGPATELEDRIESGQETAGAAVEGEGTE